jgi:hypothetical protein
VNETKRAVVRRAGIRGPFTLYLFGIPFLVERHVSPVSQHSTRVPSIEAVLSLVLGQYHAIRGKWITLQV